VEISVWNFDDLWIFEVGVLVGKNGVAEGLSDLSVGETLCGSALMGDVWWVEGVVSIRE